MPSIEISDAQAERLSRLREELGDRHVGEYGYVRPQDALQYLLDRYGVDDVEIVAGLLEERLRAQSYQDLQQLAGLTEGVDATGKEADLRERLAAARARQLLAPETWGEADVTSVAAQDDSEDAASGESAGGDGGSRLERMMGLLDEYNDRWEEAETEEGKYMVTLPDGSTESARTKEDVRALLFTHYA